MRSTPNCVRLRLPLHPSFYFIYLYFTGVTFSTTPLEEKRGVVAKVIDEYYSQVC